ncbi:MAG: hypothetical protein IKR13_02900 [Victivallales bacterium]|nr:hypothetical protein [Victivallales bacterium]
MKRLLALFCLLCLVLSAAERSRPGDADWFPICAWGMNLAHAPGPLTQEVFDTMAECGITIAGFANSREELDLIHNAGMVAWILDDDFHVTFWKGYDGEEVDWWEAAQKVTAKYADHPALYGYYIVDEPKLDHFPIVADASTALKLADPGHERYINLNPSYAPNGYLGVRSYAAHLDDFINLVQPNWFGYDFYGLMEPGRVETDRMEGWWKNLADAREAAARHGVPFQLCMLTVGHLPYRIPTEDDLFFEAFSGLLYGAKGLQFFTYFTPDLGNYRSAPIDLWGHRSPTWYALHNVLCAVHALAPVLNQLDSTAVYHFQPGEASEREDAPGENAIIRGVSGSGASLAIGEFRHRQTGDTYVMILNKNLKNSIGISGLQWRTKPTQIQVVSQQKPDKFTWFSGEGTWLAPGHAILLKVSW